MDEIKVMLAARRSVIEFENKFWIRMDNDGFVIPIESDNSAKVMDIVGIYTLFKLESEYPGFPGGLYRDNFLFTVKNVTNKKLDLYIKRFHRFIRVSFGLSISIINEHEHVNFLDVNLNLINDIYECYDKSSSNLKYINSESNHPGCIRKFLICNIS